MKQEITFELRRLIVKGCCCENCFYRTQKDKWDDDCNYPHWEKNVDVCSHRKNNYYPNTISDLKGCCMRWKQKV